MQTRVITAHIPLPLAKQIDKLAEQMERPRGWIVKQALNDWIMMEEWKHRQVLQGLADVDAGRIYSHETMGEWVNNLGKKKKTK